MPIIYLTENLFNKALGIEPWRYVGSDQHDREDYFGSSEDLRADLTRLGSTQFEKTVLAKYDIIGNKDLRKLEAVELKKLNVKKDTSYYNKSDLYAPGGGVKGMKHKKKRETSQAWIDSRTGSTWSEEQRANRTGEGNPMFGKKIKEETKEHWKKVGRGETSKLEWTIITPTGDQYSVKGLRPWCRERNINFYDVYYQKNGWTTIKHGAGLRAGSKNKRNIND